jgi:hypothetical protein
VRRQSEAKEKCSSIQDHISQNAHSVRAPALSPTLRKRLQYPAETIKKIVGSQTLATKRSVSVSVIPPLGKRNSLLLSAKRLWTLPCPYTPDSDRTSENIFTKPNTADINSTGGTIPPATPHYTKLCVLLLPTINLEGTRRLGYSEATNFQLSQALSKCRRPVRSHINM